MSEPIGMIEVLADITRRFSPKPKQVHHLEWGDFIVLYHSHTNGGREIVEEVLGYDLRGQQMNATELDQAGFQPPDETDVQWELDNEAQEPNI